MTVLIRLLFAHILSDFFLQTDAITKGKRLQNKKRFLYQVFHSLTHTTTAYIAVAEWGNWIVPLVVFSTHLTIDLAKVEYCGKSAAVFLTDQFLHIAVIVGLSLLIGEGGPQMEVLLSRIWGYPGFWTIAAAYLVVLKPTSVFLSAFIRKWTPSDTMGNSLPNAGKWIGYLERILILTFIFTDNAEAIGFLMAAKSIFRFGEMSKAQEIMTTEYVLIGTFASFTTAILIGFATAHFLQL